MTSKIPKAVTAEHEALHARQVKSEMARFAEALKVHALTEEQVLYPAAPLVGECIRARLEK